MVLILILKQKETYTWFGSEKTGRKLKSSKESLPFINVKKRTETTATEQIDIAKNELEKKMFEYRLITSINLVVLIF